jgi:hypothetical protein
LTADATTCARRAGACGHPIAESSARYAVAVDTTRPIEMPWSSRAVTRPARLFDATNTVALTIARPSAGNRTRRRPYQSERWPASSRAPITPTEYTA